MRKKGLNYEDCFYASVDRENGFYSLKGFFRMEREVSFERLRDIVEEYWRSKGKEHNAVVMPFDSGVGVWEYKKDKMLKGVLEGDYSRKHLVVSKGW